MSQSDQELAMRRCAYWIHLLGEPELATNDQSTTVHIPQAQVFSSETLITLLERSGRGEGITTQLVGP